MALIERKFVKQANGTQIAGRGSRQDRMTVQMSDERRGYKIVSSDEIAKARLTGIENGEIIRKNQYGEYLALREVV